MTREELEQLKRPHQMGLLLEDLKDLELAIPHCEIGGPEHQELRDLIQQHIWEMKQWKAITNKQLLRSKRLRENVRLSG